MANIYFRRAAEELRRGILHAQQEIDAKRRLVEQSKIETDQHVQKLNTEIRAREAEAGRPRDDQQDPSGHRAQQTRRILDLQKAISQKQKEFSLERDRILDEIRDQERDLMDLQAQASGLEGRA